MQNVTVGTLAIFGGSNGAVVNTTPRRPRLLPMNCPFATMRRCVAGQYRRAG